MKRLSSSLSLYYLPWLMILGLILSGCASTGPKGQPSAEKYTQSVMSNHSEGAQTLSCPKKIEFKETPYWRDVIKEANGCVLGNKWEEVNMLGHWLAEHESKSPWGAYFLSLVAFQDKQYSRSLWMIENALQKSPQIGIFYYQKGRVLWSMKNYSLALESFERSLKYDSGNIEAHQLMGQIYLRDLDYKNAASHLEYVFQERKKDPIILDQLSYCYFKLKKPTESLDLLKTAVDLSPQNLDLRMREAQIYEDQLKDPVEALAKYQKMQSLLKKGNLIGQLKMNLDEKITHLQSEIQQRNPASDSQKKNQEGSKK